LKEKPLRVMAGVFHSSGALSEQDMLGIGEKVVDDGAREMVGYWRVA